METQKKKNIIRYFFSNIIWSLKFIGSDQPVLFSLNILISIFFQITPIFYSFIQSRIFLNLANVFSNHTDLNGAIELLKPSFLFLIGYEVMIQVVGFINNYVNRKYSYSLQVHIDKMFIKKYSTIDIQLFKSKSISDLVKRAEDNIWRVESVTNDIIEYLSRLIGGATSVFILFNYFPFLVLLSIGISIPYLIKETIYIKKYRELYDSFTERWREYWTGRWFLTWETNLQELLVANGKLGIFKRIFDLRNNIKNQWLKLLKSFDIPDFLTRLTNIFNPISFILIAFKEILSSGNIGNVTFYYSQLDRTDRFFNVLIRDIIKLYDKLRYVEYVRNFFEIENVIMLGKTKLKLKTAPEIEFRDVSFKYPSTETYSIKNINFKVNSSEEIALVGENGAGKTTLIKLLLRIYNPTSGEILVNGKNIKTFNLESYYDHIGALFQDYNYPGFYTFREIIEMFKTRFSSNSYINAAKAADIHKAIMKSDKQYDTKTATFFEGGTELSQGQSQKLMIARLFYRNAPILILDEPTASIDAIAEAKIFNRIYKFMTQKTVIIISHRFSTVRNAQKIYVLDNGKIVEQGSHKELMKINGKYADAFNKQAEGYNKES